MSKSTNILCTELASEYTHEYWDSNPIFFYYTRLNNYLESHFGDEFNHLFAFPDFTKQENDYVITWRGKIKSTAYTKLSELNEAEYLKYREILEHKLEQLNKLIENLKSKNPKDAWITIIENAMVADGDDAVYCIDNKVIIAPWGMTKGEPKKISSFQRKIFKPSSNEGFVGDETERETIEEDEDNKGLVNEEDNQVKEKDEIFEGDTNLDNEESKADEDVKENETEENKAESVLYDNNKSNWLKKLFWILLLLLFIALLLWLMPKSCLGLGSGSPELPKVPGVIQPVKPEDIEISKDSVQYIVSDRINVLFKNNDVDLDVFANHLSQRFSNENLEIIYYDTIIKRIQLKIPKENREELKQRLKEELPEYDMVIFDESVIKQYKLPNDQAFSSPHLSWYFEPIQAIDAWDTTTGDEGLLAVVIDGGFDINHEDFVGKNIKALNVLDKTQNVFGTSQIAMHGTHVYGTMTGVMSNKKGSTGIAPICNTMAIRVTNDSDIMSTTAVVDAVLYAIKNDADVINLSLGKMFGPLMQFMPEAMQYSFIKNQLKEEEYLWNQIFGIADENNTTIVLAGGNESLMIGLDPMQRTPYTINVSAVNPNIERASFSNYGRYSTISAPGVNIYNAVPNNKYQMMDGTSMAAPIVSGGVVLIKSIYPKLSNTEIKNLLQNTGRPLNTDKPIAPLIQLANALKQGDNKKVTEDIFKNPNIPPFKRVDSVDYRKPIDLPPPLLGDSPDNVVDDDCIEINKKIDSLRQLIDYYENRCNNGNSPISDIKQDTLKMPDKIEDKKFLHGRWRSTTTIVNSNNEEVVIYFDFIDGGTDKLTLVEPNGLQCYADLNTQVYDNQLNIDQLSSAKCQNNEMYSAYTFKCRAKSNGVAQCKAQNKDLIINNFEFNLIRVK